MLKVCSNENGMVRFSLNFNKDGMEVIGYKVEYYPKNKVAIIRNFDVLDFHMAKTFFELGCKKIGEKI